MLRNSQQCVFGALALLMVASCINSINANTDPYTTLGVGRDATDAEIRKAYHKLAVTHHPDKGGDPARFREVAAAYEVLSDPEQKRLLDQGGAPQQASFAGSAHDPFDVFRDFHQKFHTEFSLDKVFEMHHKILRDMGHAGGSFTQTSSTSSTSTSDPSAADSVWEMHNKLLQSMGQAPTTATSSFGTQSTSTFSSSSSTGGTSTSTSSSTTTDSLGRQCTRTKTCSQGQCVEQSEGPGCGQSADGTAALPQ